MSSRPCRAPFETIHSALRLQTDGKSNLDRSFWILRELGNELALVGLAAREPQRTFSPATPRALSGNSRPGPCEFTR